MRVLRLSSLLFGILLFANAAHSQQVVFLDFDSGTSGSINYTAAMRNEVQSLMQGYFSRWNVSIVQSTPGSGPFSTITFNAGSSVGTADDVDLRNLNKSDNAVVNVDGLGFTTSQQFVRASASVGAHELGHLMGLRHHDSFGPIGSGVNSTTAAAQFLPDFPGPQNADETFDHLMASVASVGSSINDLLDPLWFSERSAIKLTHAEQGMTVNEVTTFNNSIATAQALTMQNMIVPNTIQSGDHAGPLDFDVDALSVVGQISTGGDIDFYSFMASAGDLMNFEVASSSVNRYNSDPIDSRIWIFDSSGASIDYYGEAAFNDDELELFDSHILDLIIPADGIYYIAINALAGGDIGGYELFFSRFNGFQAIPEPASLAMLTLTVFVISKRRERRHD